MVRDVTRYDESELTYFKLETKAMVGLSNHITVMDKGNSPKIRFPAFVKMELLEEDSVVNIVPNRGTIVPNNGTNGQNNTPLGDPHGGRF